MVKNKNKHICVIVSCLLAVMIAIMPLITLNSNKRTANADAIISSNYLVVLPSFFVDYAGVRRVVPTMFVSFDDDYYTLHTVSSYDGSNGKYVTYDKLSYTLPYNPCGKLHSFFYDGTENKVKFNDFQYNSYTWVRGDISLLSQMTNVYVYTSYDTNLSGNGFEYVFNSPSLNQDIKLWIGNFSSDIVVEANELSFDFTTIAAPVDTSSLDKYVIDSAYQRGYNDAYDIAYNKGLNTTWGDLSPFKVVVNGIDDFITAPLFGNVNLKTLFLVAFGCILFGLFIKTFFH